MAYYLLSERMRVKTKIAHLDDDIYIYKEQLYEPVNLSYAFDYISVSVKRVHLCN